MKAAVFRQLGVPVHVEEVDIDVPGPREVLVRTAAAGVCHSDLSIVDGKITELYQLPMVLGHESAGVVERVGSEVTYVRPGDHVVTCLSIFCGQCEYCLSGRPALCPHEAEMRGPGERPRLSQAGIGLTQASQLGSFAEQLLVHEHAVVKIDPRMPLDVASVLGCGLTTGLGAVIHTADVRPGETVAVIGCGGVGLGAIQGARLSGARRIVAVDRVAARLDRAAELGATDVINASSDDAVAALLDLTGGVDHVFEAVGLASTCQQALKMLRRGGRVTIIGVITTLKLEISGADLMFGRSLQWSMMGSNRFRLDIPYYIDLYFQGRLRLDEVVSDRVGLQEVNQALDALGRAEGVRTVLVF